MNVDTEQLAQLRLMRDNIGATLNMAEAMNDTVIAALLADIEHTLSERIGALVTPSDQQPPAQSRPVRFTIEAGYGRAVA